MGGQRARDDCPTRVKPAPPKERVRRLTYSEQVELKGLPDRIAALESQLAAAHARMADPALYRQDPAAIVDAKARVQTLQHDLADVYARWEALEMLLAQGAPPAPKR